uniref:Uncharacterized protein n=1 Tax=Trichuris muris TaxID=70415 RepID=A0A5S6PZL2_TRIMR
MIRHASRGETNPDGNGDGRTSVEGHHVIAKWPKEKYGKIQPFINRCFPYLLSTTACCVAITYSSSE